MDVCGFDWANENEEDYTLHDFFPKTIPYNLHYLMEHRIKLILKEDTVFHGGEIKVVNTCLMLDKKSKETRLSMFLIPHENLSLAFESGGYINRNYNGRVLLKLGNYSLNNIKLQCGTPVGYIVMQPYSLEK